VTRHERRHELVPARELPEREAGARRRTRARPERLPRLDRVAGQRAGSMLPWAAFAASVARTKNPERLARQIVWRTAGVFVPAPLRRVVRVIGRLLPGESH
jgi:hypothetical protein